jgi:ELWxxDGT repeat protein
MVKDIYAGSAGSNPSGLVAVGSTVFFTANDGAWGNELWRSDGTAAGTAMVKDIYAGNGGASIKNMINVGGTLYFSAYTTACGAEPWMSDGTAAGTVMVQDIYAGSPSSNPSNMVASGSSIFLTATDATHSSRLFVNAPSTPSGLQAPTGAAMPAVADGGIAAALASLAGLDQGGLPSRPLTRNR